MNWYKQAELLIKYIPRAGQKVGIDKNPTEEEFKGTILDDKHGMARVMIMPNLDMYVYPATDALHIDIIDALNLQGYIAAVTAEIYKGRIIVDGINHSDSYEYKNETISNAVIQRYPYLELPQGFLDGSDRDWEADPKYFQKK